MVRFEESPERARGEGLALTKSRLEVRRPAKRTLYILVLLTQVTLCDLLWLIKHEPK